MCLHFDELHYIHTSFFEICLHFDELHFIHTSFLEFVYILTSYIILIHRFVICKKSTHKNTHTQQQQQHTQQQQIIIKQLL